MLYEPPEGYRAWIPLGLDVACIECHIRGGVYQNVEEHSKRYCIHCGSGWREPASKPPSALPYDKLIQARHSVHLERLRHTKARLSAGETHDGVTSLDELAVAAKAAALELEHLAGVLGIELDEWLGE